MDSDINRASAITLNENQSIASTLIVSTTAAESSLNFQSSFSETTLQHTTESELRDSQFQAYYQDIEERIQKETEVMN